MHLAYFMNFESFLWFVQKLKNNDNENESKTGWNNRQVSKHQSISNMKIYL